MRELRACVILWATGLFLSACPSTTGPNDGGDGGAEAATDVVDDGGLPCNEAALHSLHPSPIYLRLGGTADAMLRLVGDRGTDATYTITSSNAAVVGVMGAAATGQVAIRRGLSTAQFTLNGASVGRAMLRAQQIAPTPPISCRMATMSVEVIVLDPAVPACPMTTAPVTGRMGPGMRVAGPAGSPLEQVSIVAPVMAMNIAPMDVTLRCAPDQLPAGFEAVGPAVTIAPQRFRFEREVYVTIPVNPSRVPSFYELSTEISYTAPSWTRPRIVAQTDTRFSHDGRALMFRATRTGTYQAVIRQGLGTRRSRRHYVYRALLGASMGAMGASMIGTRHPELFDLIMPLGGSADFGFFAHVARDFLLGGFCTEADRATMGAACDRATDARTPAPDDQIMPDQNFEFFYYPTGTQGQGTSGDRHTYGNIFFDLSNMFGNPFVYPDPRNARLPLGVDPAELMRTNPQRCSNVVSLGGRAGMPRFYDDEFNPTGDYPVITFCDGTNTRMNAGEWDGSIGDQPYDALLAVDRNRNGRRDRGEPVIRNFWEPYQDVGTDGLPNAREPGYDAMNNSDPNGDDYDRVYNPAGTEGNWLHDMGEPYQDVGLDGVRCPAGETCPFDYGEGNGRFDTTPGVARFREYNGREILTRMPQEDVHRMQMWGDGGYRDFFNLGTSAHHWMGAVSQRGEDLHAYGAFSSLMGGHRETNQACTSNAECATGPGGAARSDWYCDRGTCRPDDGAFVHTDVDYVHLPAHNLLRYGHEDITMSQYLLGDGGHVGTVPQITNRTFVALWFVQARWPRMDRVINSFSSMRDDAGRCANGYLCAFDFMSPRTGRTGPVSVYLPPGYHRPENRNNTYPVVYFMHGYGMDPTDLLASGLLVGNYMSSGVIAEWQRPGKFIMVFPDGRCRSGDGCTRGTFYVDSPIAGNARMETYFLDLFDFISRTYRVRPAEDVEIVE